MILCDKCSGRMIVDRVFTTYDHLEIYCLMCGKRKMFRYPEQNGKWVKWIMKLERERVKINGNSL
jgi:hypothetical protein